MGSTCYYEGIKAAPAGRVNSQPIQLLANYMAVNVRMNYIIFIVYYIVYGVLLSTGQFTSAAAAAAANSSAADDAEGVSVLKQCLQMNGVKNFTKDPGARNQVLEFSLQNLRFSQPGVLKPAVIILPESGQVVQASLICFLKARGNRPWQLRFHSGGHSYEGRSYTADQHFVIIDLMNMHAVHVELQAGAVDGHPTAWIEAGATLGEIYYNIARATSDRYGFPAGICPTVGSGGHFSAGGYGFLSRKYGVSADNVLDAQIVTADLQLKTSLLEDTNLLWALRGGGGGSWGIVVAWKIQLVPVTPIVTTIHVTITDQLKLPNLMFQWQYLASTRAPDDLEIVVRLTAQGDGNIIAEFYGQYLGTRQQTVTWFEENFSDLGLEVGNCKVGKWIEAVAINGRVESPSDLTNRWFADKNYFKAKSDFVRRTISERDWNVIINALVKKDLIVGALQFNRSVFFEPSGGIMWRIKSPQIAYPHRAGNLFSIQYLVSWSMDIPSGEFPPNLDEYMEWIINFYNHTMSPFVYHVEDGVRAAYVAFLDLDLGNSTSAPEASKSWGRSYFLDNFDRLVDIKTRVDPENVFNMPQSIPVSKLAF